MLPLEADSFVKGGPSITHIFFVDNIILFRDATIHQMKVIHKCLSDFCNASGQKVNFEKSKMLVSRNVLHQLARSLSQVTEICLTSNLGKYLGDPLIHKRPTKETYQFILDITNRCLASWKANCLSFAGRVTLTKSVIQALPPYCMQTMLLPKGVCHQLEKS